MAIRIITDTTCDIPYEEREKLGIDILPLTVYFGEEGFRDRIDITSEQFYERLKTVDKLPTTSQIYPSEFEKIFAEYAACGDSIICIHISSELSGTMQSAAIAREKFPDAEIYVIDSQYVAYALGILVLEAVKLRDSGLAAAEIVERVEKLRERVRIYAVVDDIKYFKMGGRLSGAGAALVNILNIKPIVHMKGGKIHVFPKERGMKNAFNAIAKTALEDNIDFDMPFIMGAASMNERIDALKRAFGSSLERQPDYEVSLSPVVGTHTGPGCTGIAFFVK